MHLTDNLPADPELPTVVESSSERELSETVSDFDEEPISSDDEPPLQNAIVPANTSTSLSSAIDVPDLGESPLFNLPKLAPGLPEDFLLETAPKPKATFWRNIGLSLIILTFGFAGLGGQYVFFHAPKLSQKIEYRPWLQRFCDFLPCELAAYSDLQHIHVERLSVHSHPDLADSLIVELILTNTASDRQAYPGLVLRFDDLAGRQIAARRFSPREYLPQNLATVALMPMDKAVSIKLAIVDPGETAVSYSVSTSK